MIDLGINIDCFSPKIFYVYRKNSTESVKIHTHDFPSLVYVLSGSATYKVNGKEYKASGGDLVAINPGVPHGKIMEAGEEVNEFHIGFNNIQLEGLQKDFIISEDLPPVISLKKNNQDFFQCCGDILVEQKKDEPGGQLMLKAHVMRLIVLMLREIYMGSSEEEESPINFDSYEKTKIVTAIASFINNNYGQDISLDKISRNMYLSPVYISKIFKEEIGESPINYLIKVRLSKAAELLEQGSITIKNVARQVGYGDAYYFSKLFKKYYGVPPSKYRRKLSGQ